MTLADLAIGAPARISGVQMSSDVVHRLMEMGMTTGAPVSVVKVVNVE